MAGVMLAALGSHGADGRLLTNAATMCLAHAPAVLAMAALLPRAGLAGAAGYLLVAGTMLFSGDMVTRHELGHGLFPIAAPAGGLTMMAGWLLVIAAGIFARRD